MSDELEEFPAIRSALQGAFQSIDGAFTVVYDVRPDQVNVPAVIIQPQDPFIEYVTRGGNSAKALYHLEGLILVGGVNSQAAQNRIDKYISPNGPIIPMLQRFRVPGLFSYITVTQARGYGKYKGGSTDYPGCILAIDVMT